MSERIRAHVKDAAVMIALACALATTGLVVRRELISDSTPTKRLKKVSPTVWHSLTASGHRLGTRDAPLTVVVFADFQCPACRQFALGPLAQIRSQFADEVSIVFRHWPLPYHPHAHATAVAAECAAAQGVFQEFHDLVYSKQDSLGEKPLVAYAVESGVRDTIAFLSCLKSPIPARAIERDADAAQAIGAVGTPTVIANARQFVGYPTAEQLAELMRARN